MNREALLNQTINNISLLPDWRLKELSNYVDFLLKTYNDKKDTSKIMKLLSESKSFDFLKEEDDIYDESDLIEKF